MVDILINDPIDLSSMDNTKQQVVNLDTKSQLAKLIATENIEVQHNKVKTASFDTLNRILTLLCLNNNLVTFMIC